MKLTRYQINKYIKLYSLWKYTFKTANRNINVFSFEIYLYNGFAFSLVILNFGIQINFYDSDKVMLKRYGLKITEIKDRIVYTKQEDPHD
jgi:hypothetical protein